MFDRFSRSWSLVKASGAVLMQDKTLILFPLISAISTIAVMLCFALPAMGLGAFDGMSHGGRGSSCPTISFLPFCFISASTL
jgi:hypothetical protein